MTFRAAVEATPEIQNAWRRSLQALRNQESNCINAANTRLLSGSVDLDTALRQKYPQEARWDYAVGYRPSAGETVYWVEFHPANDAGVTEVLAKLNWLKQWLTSAAPTLGGFPREFIWISSGQARLIQNSPQMERLAQAGVRHVGRVLRIPS